jgi:membrane-bound inhibitor of C-type lysozyme
MLIVAGCLASCTTGDVQEEQSERTGNSSTINNGKAQLDLSFNNAKDTAFVVFNGEKITLVIQKTESGSICYKNDHYELTGKKDTIVLRKDGQILFSNQDEIVEDMVINKKGQMLYMRFNLTTDIATLKLDNKTIELKGDTVASGIKYSNADYEFKEWHGIITLKKGGSIVFTHTK